MQHWDLRSLSVAPHQPEVLQSEGEGRSIVIQLPAGDALGEHQVHERAWLVVVDGEVELVQNGGSERASAGRVRKIGTGASGSSRAFLARSAARYFSVVVLPVPGPPRITTRFCGLSSTA